MRWTIRFPEPSAPSSSADSDDDLARLIIDEMSGDLGMTYVNDVASWYARENIRSGYQIRVAGHCFKGPYAIMWDQIQIIFEDERSEEHTSELQSLMRISYAVFCLKKTNTN